MNASRLFILRPVATTLIMLAIFLSGLIAYRLLPVSALPEVDYPTIRVMTLYPGASPDVMTSAVTAPGAICRSTTVPLRTYVRPRGSRLE